jgi:hypothetical protein
MHNTPLSDDDCFAVRQAARRISQFYERYLSRANVTPSQYSILALLRDTRPVDGDAVGRPGDRAHRTVARAEAARRRGARQRPRRAAVPPPNVLVDRRGRSEDRRSTGALARRPARIRATLRPARAARLRDELFTITHDLATR